MRSFVWFAAALGVGWVCLASPARAAPQTAAQQACVARLNRAGGRVAGAVVNNLARCARDMLAARLPAGQTLSQCADADRDGRVARARATTATVFAGYCTTVADFGANDPEVVNASFGAVAPAAELFGNDPDAALDAGAASSSVAACQLAALRYATRTLARAVTLFDQCTRSGLADRSIDDRVAFGACFDASHPSVSAFDLLSRCSAVNLAAALPGACANESVGELPECIARLARCETAQAVEAANAVSTLRPHRFSDGIATRYCGTRPGTPLSIARQWDEEALAAIRIDFPRPPLHARNLFHLSVAMWDAWAAYDPLAHGYLVTEKQTASDVGLAREATISFAAYRVLVGRYASSPNAATTARALQLRMNALGLDPSFAAEEGDLPAALGNRIAAAVLAHGRDDGANESANYADPTYTPANEPLIVKLAGVTMHDPNRWQPLALDVFIGQNGIPIPENVQTFVGSQWGAVSPFAIDLPTLLPAPPPQLHDPQTDGAFKQQALEVVRFASRLTPDDPALIDISPASFGNNPLGTNDGNGYALNPATGQPYAPQLVKRGDFGRVLAEFWADGPTSETPPGHWNTIANYTVDHPAFERRFGGAGAPLDPLQWDVKMYLALNGALHDAAIGAWGSKRVYDSVRPISMIRYMAGLGQSSDPFGPSYHPDGLPLEPGLVEVITAESSAPGERHAALADYVGEIAVLSWPGEPLDPESEYSGVEWVRAAMWVPYQRKTFVTPPFAAYVSGHSTFSRAAAEVLTRLTGTPYFPAGLGVFTAPKDTFLAFEVGPSAPVTLEWATYYDAADQAGLSRLWGGIHISADDFTGRVLGATIGKNAYDLAVTHFDGTAGL